MNVRQWTNFVQFIKLYLALEEWFHDVNDKDEVRIARGKISQILGSLQKFFPRSDNTNGYCIPKMHGMTKMQFYIQLFGSGMNFYGGRGEAAIKTFVKSAGQKSQGRVSEFAQQTATQYYHMLLSSCAVQNFTNNANCRVQVGCDEIQEIIETQRLDPDDDATIVLSGKYEIILTPLIIEEMRDQHTVTVLWHSKNTEKTNNPKNELCRDLVRCLYRKITQEGEHITHITGYTKAVVTSLTTNEKNIFYSHPCYQGEEWYDWAMVHYEETNQAGDNIETYYPSKLLGFIETNGTREAVIQCSVNPLLWDDIQQNFVCIFNLDKTLMFHLLSYQ